jgi:hypothetical protein
VGGEETAVRTVLLFFLLGHYFKKSQKTIASHGRRNRHRGAKVEKLKQ